jgi:hypothetical protein
MQNFFFQDCKLYVMRQNVIVYDWRRKEAIVLKSYKREFITVDVKDRLQF